MNIAFNIDYIEGIVNYPDKHFDLAVVDPPYGSDNIKGGYSRGEGGGIARQKIYNKALWSQNRPTQLYFKELFRVSKNQIIFGANHFISEIPIDSPCWLVWDKKNGDNSFADCELAWTSFNTALRKFSFQWQGMLQENMRNKEIRYHPTQKPIALYDWIFKNYTKQGDKILDTHLGSGSSRIAAYKAGLDFTAYELDSDYFEQQEKRFNTFISQTSIFQITN